MARKSPKKSISDAPEVRQARGLAEHFPKLLPAARAVARKRIATEKSLERLKRATQKRDETKADLERVEKPTRKLQAKLEGRIEAAERAIESFREALEEYSNATRLAWQSLSQVAVALSMFAHVVHANSADIDKKALNFIQNPLEISDIALAAEVIGKAAALIQKPQELGHAHSEDEIKATVTDGQTLTEIFTFAATDAHYAEPGIENLAANAWRAGNQEITPYKLTYFFDNHALAAFNRGGKKKAEIRSRRRSDKGYDTHKMAVKVKDKDANGDGDSDSLKRRETENWLKGYGVNFDVLPPEIQNHLAELGVIDTETRALVKSEGQSMKRLYHPGGNTDILLEIKCDDLRFETFDGGFSQEKLEVEIEVVWRSDNLSSEDVDKIVKEEMQRLIERFGGDKIAVSDVKTKIKIVRTSKPEEAFKYLLGLQEKNPEAFELAVRALPPTHYVQVDIPELKAA